MKQNRRLFRNMRFVRKVKCLLREDKGAVVIENIIIDILILAALVFCTWHIIATIRSNFKSKEKETSASVESVNPVVSGQPIDSEKETPQKNIWKEADNTDDFRVPFEKGGDKHNNQAKGTQP